MVDNLIKLFESNSTSFTSNGIGILKEAISCTVTEELNGSFELEMVYPITGIRFSDLSFRRIIVTKANPYSPPQAFRIYAITKPINGLVTVNAEHISYDLSGYPVSPFSAYGISNFVESMKSASVVPCPFNFYTNKTNTDAIEIDKPSSIRSILGKEILDIYKGEYEFDNFDVKILENRGMDRGMTIRYGKNLTNLKQEENNSQVFTAVYPYYYSADDHVELQEKIVPVTGTFDYQRIYPLDLSSIFSDTPTESQLREAANRYIEENNIGVPKVSLDVSFIQIGQAKEYTNIAILETVQLGDTVHVRFPKMNVTANSKCIKTKYDALTNRYIDIELGEAESSLSSTIVSQSEAIKNVPTRSFVDMSIENATNLITGNLGGHVLIHSSIGLKKPNEILIMDTDDITTASNVWRWNIAGFGHSSNGYSGNYGTAITMDGRINADYMTLGTLRAIDIQGCNLNISEKFIVNRNGDVDITGKITATEGVIGGCIIDNNGVLQIKNVNISELLEASKINCTGVIEAASATIKGLAAEEISATSIIAQGVTVSKNDETLLYAEDGVVTIGAFTVDRNDTRSYIYCNEHDYLDDVSHSGVYLGTDGLDLLGVNEGGSVTGNLKFRVSDGSLKVVGTIEATDGIIGGCPIEDGVLKIKSINLTEKLTFDQLPEGTITIDDLPSIPSSLSDLYNDMGFQTATQVTSITNNTIMTTNVVAQNLVVKKLQSATGSFGASTYKFNIGNGSDSYNSPCLYTRSNAFSGIGGLGTVYDNYVYIGGDGFSYWNGLSSSTDYNTAIRPGVVFCSGCNNMYQTQNRAIALRNGSLDFFYGGDTNLRNLTSSGQLYACRVAYMDVRQSDVYLYGSFIGNSSGSIVSDRSKKNSISYLDDRYGVLFDNLAARLYKYNDGQSGRFHCGFIADEVLNAMNEAELSTTEFAAYIESVNNDGSILKGLRYEEFIALCVNEIQKLKTEMENLKNGRTDI